MRASCCVFARVRGVVSPSAPYIPLLPPSLPGFAHDAGAENPLVMQEVSIAEVDNRESPRNVRFSASQTVVQNKSQARILCLTWNVGNKPPNEAELEHWLPAGGGVAWDYPARLVAHSRSILGRESMGRRCGARLQDDPGLESGPCPWATPRHSRERPRRAAIQAR